MDDIFIDTLAKIYKQEDRGNRQVMAYIYKRMLKLSYKEIAEKMEIEPLTVGRYIWNVRNRLREMAKRYNIIIPYDI